MSVWSVYLSARLRACSVAAQQQQLALCSMCARSVRQVERYFD